MTESGLVRTWWGRSLDEESQIIARAQGGDVRAFEMLVRAHEQLAFRAAYLITRDRDEAADTAQDAFVNAHRSLESFELGQPFKPWLLRIVKNLALNRVRSAQRRAKATDRYHERLILETEDGSPEDMAAKRDQERRLLLAVLKLTPEEQWLVSLRYFLELPEDQVAQTLDIPLGTCKSRLHRTLARLREIIEDEALNSESSRTG